MIGILPPLPEKSNGTQLGLVKQDRYSKLSRAIPTPCTPASGIWSLLMDHCVIPCIVAQYMLTDKRNLFVSKCFELLCNVLGTKHQRAMLYHSRRAGKQSGWKDNNDQSKVTMYRNINDIGHSFAAVDVHVNTQRHRSIIFLHFSLVLSGEAPGPTTSIDPTIRRHYGLTPQKTQPLNAIEQGC